MRATAATLLSQSLPRALAARCRGLAPPLQRRTYERRGVVRATAGRFWRRLPDGERIGERALRLQDSSRREARLLPDTGEPIVDRVQLKELHPPHAHELDAATLHGVNNEPQPHHNEVRREAFSASQPSRRSSRALTTKAARDARRCRIFRYHARRCRRRM